MDPPMRSNTRGDFSVVEGLRRLYEEVEQMRSFLSAETGSQASARHKAVDTLSNGTSTVPGFNNAAYKLSQVMCWNSTTDGFMRAYDLCGAPGGFVRALAWRFRSGVDVVGVTLHDLETYKFGSPHLVDGPFRLYREGHAQLAVWHGSDGKRKSGDIFSEGLSQTLLRYGGRRLIVLADGAFSIEGRWDQGVYLFPMFLREASIGVDLTAVGGAFVLKVLMPWFDVYVSLYFTLQEYFDRVDMVKPQSSRAANAEVYVFCWSRNTRQKPVDCDFDLVPVDQSRRDCYSALVRPWLEIQRLALSELPKVEKPKAKVEKAMSELSLSPQKPSPRPKPRRR